MSILSFLRRTPASAPRTDLEDQIRRLEARSEQETGHVRARLLNQAGDLCVQAGDLGRAKGLFGRTIDTYLEAGYFEAAAAICRKMIRLSPDVVRARATLALIYLGKKLVQNAEYEVELVEDYIQAARAAGQTELLVYRLRVMTQATENQELRVLLGQHLMELGDDEFGRRVLYSIYREVSGLDEPRDLDPEEQWQRLLQAATMNPNDLRHIDLPMDRAEAVRPVADGTAALPGMMAPLAGAALAAASAPDSPSAATPPKAAPAAPAPSASAPDDLPLDVGLGAAGLALELPGDARAPVHGGDAPDEEDDEGKEGDEGEDDLPMLGGDLPAMGAKSSELDRDLSDFGNVSL